MAKYFRRTVYQIELLEEIASELELAEGTIDELSDVVYAMTDGSASGSFTVVDTELVTPEKAREICLEHGTDPTYFGLVALEPETDGRTFLVKPFPEAVEVEDWQLDTPILAYGVRVDLAELGEGMSGDYNEEDPNDEELLRFDVAFVYFEEDGSDNLYQPQDHSYCTLLPVSLSDEDRYKAMKFIMDAVYGDMLGGTEASRTLERISWIDPTWLTDNPSASHNTMIVNNPYDN